MTTLNKQLVVYKYLKGDSVSNEELDFLIELFSSLDAGLKLLGAEYKLARVPIIKHLENVESIKIARTK